MKTKLFLSIFILTVVFVLAIAYTFISSKMDQSRQEAILREKQKISEAEKEPLERCLAYEEQSLESWKEIARGMWRAEAKECLNDSSLCRRSGDAMWNDLSRTLDSLELEAETKKEECYKRYK
jgi:hypothetical protein